MNNSESGIALVGLTLGFSAFTHFLPKLSDIRKADETNDEFAADVRMGLIAAVGVTVGTGAVVSGLVKSNIPAVVAISTAFGFVVLYEYALRANHPMEVKNNGN